MSTAAVTMSETSKLAAFASPLVFPRVAHYAASVADSAVGGVSKPGPKPKPTPRVGGENDTDMGEEEGFTHVEFADVLQSVKYVTFHGVSENAPAGMADKISAKSNVEDGAGEGGDDMRTSLFFITKGTSGKLTCSMIKDDEHGHELAGFDLLGVSIVRKNKNSSNGRDRGHGSGRGPGVSFVAIMFRREYLAAELLGVEFDLVVGTGKDDELDNQDDQDQDQDDDDANGNDGNGDAYNKAIDARKKAGTISARAAMFAKRNKMIQRLVKGAVTTSSNSIKGVNMAYIAPEGTEFAVVEKPGSVMKLDAASLEVFDTATLDKSDALGLLSIKWATYTAKNKCTVSPVTMKMILAHPVIAGEDAANTTTTTPTN